MAGPIGSVSSDDASISINVLRHLSVLDHFKAPAQGSGPVTSGPGIYGPVFSSIRNGSPCGDFVNVTKRSFLPSFQATCRPSKWRLRLIRRVKSFCDFQV